MNLGDKNNFTYISINYYIGKTIYLFTYICPDNKKEINKANKILDKMNKALKHLDKYNEAELIIKSIKK